MGTLDQLVTISISVTARAPSQKGFGVPMLFTYHNAWMDLIREYSEPSELLDDGFVATDPTYLMATALASQDPHPPTFKVGRRATAFTQTFTLTPVNTTEGFVYEFSVGDVDISYTVLAAATVNSIATALQPLIDAATDLTAVDSTGYVTCTADNAGELHDVDLGTLDPKADIVYDDNTTDPGIATDIAAVQNIDDDWYGVALDSNSPAEALALAAWLETQKKIGAVSLMNGDISDSALSSDALSTMVAASYTRILPMVARRTLLDYRAVAMLAEELPKTPGSSTWSFKTLAGIEADTWKTNQFTAIQNKNGTTYTEIGGVNITYEAKTPAGEYIDIPQFIDWLHARIQEAVFGVLVTVDKLGYTDAGVEVVASAIRAVLRRGVVNGGLVEGTTTVTAPLVADVALADRAARRLPDVRFTGQLAGAIHKLVISGNVTV